MKRYKNIQGSSGVSGYETGDDRITIAFQPGHVYVYTYASAGKRMVEHMKALAEKGKGLSTYISRKVRDKYERKIK